MMNRRIFLQLTGLVAVGQALSNLPVAAASDLGLGTVGTDRYANALTTPPNTPLALERAGTYRISGLVRLQAPLVEIGGIADKQSISWSTSDGVEPPLASFVVFERYDRPGMTPNIQVQGGQIEALTAVLLD
jgi:hypothetical protein